MRLSNGRASPVRTVMLTRAVLAMVTFSSWMVNVRTSIFTVRIPVWNRNGLTLRSVGSSGILLLVHCVRERCVAHRRVRRVLGVLCIWVCLLCLSFPSCLQDSGYGGVPITGHALWAEVGGGIICVTLGKSSVVHKNALGFFGVMGVIPVIWCL